MVQQAEQVASAAEAAHKAQDEALARLARGLGMDLAAVKASLGPQLAALTADEADRWQQVATALESAVREALGDYRSFSRVVITVTAGADGLTVAAEKKSLIGGTSTGNGRGSHYEGQGGSFRGRPITLPQELASKHNLPATEYPSRRALAYALADAYSDTPHQRAGTGPGPIDNRTAAYIRGVDEELWRAAGSPED